MMLQKIDSGFCFTHNYTKTSINMSLLKMMKFSAKMGFNKTTVYNTVSDIGLKTHYKSILPFYHDKIIVSEYKIYGTNVVRIWKNSTIIGIDSSPKGGDRMIGSMDYSVSNNRFKVEYLYVIDSDSGCFESDPKYVNAKEYTGLMVSFAVEKARELGIDDITMDTHQSLRLYHRYYVEEGFFLTGNASDDHSAWVEMRKNVSLYRNNYDEIDTKMQ
jgi:hypothetical protein